MNSSWIDKYSVQQFDDFIGNEHVRNSLQNMTESNQFNHLILIGPEGVGKKTLISLVLKSYQIDFDHENVLFLRMCEDRSIQCLRERFHEFVPKKTAVYKFIIIQYAEMITEGVQHMMRRLMDKYVHSTIFIFLCKQLNGVLDCIRSRSLIFYMSGFSYEEYSKKIKYVLQNEEVQIESSEDLKLLYHYSKGNLRYTFQYLELLACYCSTDKKISQDLLKKLCICPYYSILEDIVKAIDNSNIYDCYQYIYSLRKLGLHAIDIIFLIKESFLIYRLSPTFTEKINRHFCIVYSQIAKYGENILFILYFLIKLME
jgi:DNA polymerase III delta prime subunit